MPCNCDYMNANGLETSISRVACLIDELKGKKWDKRSWDGYHPAVYSQPGIKLLGDKLTEELCTKLKKKDVTKYSLEMQMWWRDHQAADKAKEKTSE